MQGTREDATDSVTLDELLKMSRAEGELAPTHHSDIPQINLDYRVNHEASARTLRGRTYWFLRWCIDWIEPSKY